MMRRAGVPAEKLRVLGLSGGTGVCFATETLPVRPDPAGPEGRRVLYMINAGRKAAPETVRRLLQIEDIALTVTVGRDEEMRAMVESAIAKRGPVGRPVTADRLDQGSADVVGESSFAHQQGGRCHDAGNDCRRDVR